MKRPVQHLIRHSFLILFGLFFLLQFIKCKSSNSKGDVGYGKSFFMKRCSACHGRNDGFNNAPSMLTLNSYDSMTLVKKLTDIKKDSTHSDYLHSIKYSKKEVNSIYKFIRHYYTPHY